MSNTDVNYIIVQAGGKGTRMEYLTYNKPKALVPIENLPMLFHLFRKYNEAHFIVIGDYKYEVLEKYLQAFAEVDYHLVDARGKKGTCAGIRDALDFIPEASPFMLIWSDLILPKEYKMPVADKDYVGISKDFRCRWSYKDEKFAEEPSEDQGVAGHFIFTDKNKVSDVPVEGEFVRWLQSKEMIMEEYPLYRTKEYGLLSEYQKLTGSRCRPFNRITVDGDKIIKEGIDEQGRALAVRENAWYQKVKEENFKNVPKIYSTNPIVMEKVDGKNIFEYDLSLEEKKNVLNQLVECIHEIHNLEGCETDKDSFYDAYIGKTFKRLEKVEELVPFAKDEYITINGRKCKNVFYCKEELEDAVMKYLPKEFRLLHGDCTFSNMMLKNGTTPVMIDPRGYFGTTELYGDPAYDWVKLYYSLVGNYDQFNLKRFRLQIEETEVNLEIESNHWEDVENEFFRLLGDEVTPAQMKLLHSIIWLSLTTYAWEDYDSICGAFYNGLLYLTDYFEEV
ncbi:MAG: NTP transferase domain-containing protein [Lachnospiraceae bacterium]|nr:NTP transferase domain-containing protein [Lachnospiraceae bacterium]